MKKVSMIVHQNYVEDVIKSLHEAGIFEIIDIAKEDPLILEETEKAEMHPEANTCTNYELRLARLSSILKKSKKSPSGIKAILKPQTPEVKTVEKLSLYKLYSNAEDILHEIEDTVINFEDKIKQLDEKKEKINFDIEQVSYLLDFKLDVSDIKESNFLVIKAGITFDLSELENEINSLDQAALYSRQFGTGKNRKWAVVIVAHISQREKIEKICREKITVFDIQHLSGSPKDVIKTLEKDKKSINEDKNQIVSKLKLYAKENLLELQALEEEIRLERARKEIIKKFAKTDSTFIVEGWVLEKDEDKLKNIVSSISEDNMIFSSETPSANPDNPPIYLETPKWAASFKTFLELFATPKYNELNPTVFMGIFFIIFFGLMLGDAGYGLIILIFSLYGFFKIGKLSSMIRTWSFLGIWLGFVTIIIGFLTNSFFGDFVPRFIYRNDNLQLYSFDIMGIHLPLDSLGDPLTILVIALIFGLIHLNLGIILGMFQSVKRRDFKTMFTKHFCWIPLQLGGGMLVGTFIMGWQIEGAMFYIAGLLTIIGIILLFTHSGPIGFFDITGFVGDWLSYARLLALGLATAGMALAFNIVSQLIGDMIPIIGIVITVILLIFSHLANLLIQTLGAGVHSLRLQYVEFFNRFYEGGGSKFSPFKIHRKFTKIKEKIDM